MRKGAGGLLVAVVWAAIGTAAADGEFYVPENPRYTIVASVVDSLRFTVPSSKAKASKKLL